MRSFLSGWKAVVCALAVAVLVLAPTGSTLASNPTSILGDGNSGIALNKVEDSGASVKVKRYARTNFNWPFATGPVYGQGRSQTDGPGMLHTQVGSFNLITGLDIPESLRTTNKLDKLGAQYFIVSVHPDAVDTSTELESIISNNGGAVMQALPVNSVIARLTPAAFAAVQSQVGVMAVEPYHPAFKINPLIGRLPHTNPLKATSEVLSLQVLVFPGENEQQVAAEIAKLGGNVTSITPGLIRADVAFDADHMAKLAGLEPVSRIFEDMPIVMHGEETTTAVQVGPLTGRAVPYHDAGVDGSGAGKANTSQQVLMIVDSGIQLDAGDLSDTRTSAGTPSGSHRKVRFYGPTAPFGGGGDGLGCDDLAQGGSTHGHVVAATALGNATNVDTGTYGAGWQAEDPNNQGTFYNLDGVAPGAVLIAYDAQVTPAVVNCGDPQQGIFLVGDLYSGGSSGSMGEGYSNGARIFNHSWGSDSNVYDGTAIKVDTFLRDKSDAMVFISAGNNGQDSDNDNVPDPASIGTPGTTKNGVSMGASGALDDQGVAANINERATFSSVGPAGAQGRIAPLLMAPGQERGTSGINSEFTCRSNDNNQLDPVECDIVTGLAGTSFSSPAAAGSALLVRDYFAQGFYPDGTGSNPGNAGDQVDVDGGELSGATVKAALIASAEFLGRNFSGQAPNGIDNLTIRYRFNREQGYGRIQLDNVLPLQSWPGSVSGLVITDGVATNGRKDINGLIGSVNNSGGGATDSGTFEVCNTGEELRVAVVWMDPPADNLVNDLDVTLQAPSGEQYYGNYFTDDDNRDGQMTGADVDCGGVDSDTAPDGDVDSTRWSIPLSTCAAGSPHDDENPTEAIFLSPDPDADGETDDGLSQIEEGTWTITVTHNGGAGSSNQPYAVVVSGGVCLGSSVRYDSSSYVCNDLATITVNELVDANDPATPLDSNDIADRITLNVIGQNVCSNNCASCTDNSDCTGGATCEASMICDSETGNQLASNGAVFTQPDVGSPRFVLEDLVLTDGTAFDPGNGALDVRDGFLVDVQYQDDDGVGGAAPGDLVRISSARVNCKVDLAVGTITFGQFGQDTTYDIVGGCERNARGFFEFGFPDLHMDAGETISYNFAFGSNELNDLQNVEVELSCVQTDSDSPADCLPDSETCADPNRTNNSDCSGLLTVLDSPKTIGLLPAGAAISANFTVSVNPALTGTPKVEMLLKVTGATSGKTASSLAVNRHTLNVDEVSLFYSTDFPTGGTQLVDLNENEHIEDPITKIGDFLLDYQFETRTWSDLTAGGTINLGLESPWNFDNSDGGFTSGLGAVTDDATITDIIAQWGEDKDFNGILSGRCVEDNSVACNRFPNDPINCPANLDPGSTVNNFKCTNLEDRDPTNSPIPLLDQNWSTDGGCGWQTKAPNTCSNDSSLGCYEDSQCDGGTCTGTAPAAGGVWHTGGISDRSVSTGGGGCLYTGNNVSQGDCQAFETISGTDGVKTWFEVLLTPEIQKVNQGVDGEGDPVYQTEITWWAWNQALDLPDNNVFFTWEFDTDTAALEPLDLVSDLTLLNFGSGSIGAVTGGSNPELTNGYSVFAPVAGAGGVSTNGSLGNDREGRNSCFFEGGGVIPAENLGVLGFAAPPDDDLLNGYCDAGNGNKNVTCTYVCVGGSAAGDACNVGADCPGGGSCSSTADPACDGNPCVRGSNNIADVDQYVTANGPTRNMNIFAFNGPDMRFSTLEDIYGDTGNTFQGAIGFLNFEADSSDNLPGTGFGLAVDDVVVEWREFRLDEDTTSCASGQCAVLDLKTTNFYEGNALLDVTLFELSPYGSRCASTGFCTISGAACSGSCASGEGSCESAVCFSNGDCPNTDCTASTNDCDGNAWYFDGNDDSDCDNNGTDDIMVRVTSETEPAGERIPLNLESANTYNGQIPISSSYDVPGVLLVQAQGTDNPSVTVRYDDIDDGTGSQICLNDVDPAAQGEVQAGTTVFLTSGNVVVTGVSLDDNRDQDGFADDNETVTMRVEVSNKTGVALTNVSLRLASSDPDIDCILDTFIAMGDMAIEETRLSTDEFVFKVGNIGRTDDLADITGDFTISISADEFDNAVAPQQVKLDLDLDATGGSGPFTFQEGFETGTLGSFTTMWIEQGLNSLAASDGYRCQYSDPDWPNSNSFGSAVATDCYLNPTGEVTDTYFWKVLADRSFTGSNALYFGIKLTAALGYTTPFSHMQAVRSNNPINLGWDTVCSVTRTTPCADAGDCPSGEACVTAQPRLTFKQQISMIDSRTVNVVAGESADRGVVHLQLANGSGTAVGSWIKLESIKNVYDQQGTDNYTNCLFDPIDDGNTEDDFFDPTDPDRRLGPSSTCFPAFSWTYVGDTFSPFSAANIGNATDGPGLQGVGIGTWVESEVPLDRFRGRRVRLRFLNTGLKLGATTNVESAFAPFNPDPGDDGWWIDDIRVRDALASPATVSVDTKDNSALPGCGNTCNTVNAALSATPSSLGAPGQVVELTANASAADKCLNGTLQYRFWADNNGNSQGGDSGDTLLRSWTDNPLLVDAPSGTTNYVVDVRCATSQSCADSQPLLVSVNCPSSGNLGGVFQTVRAPNKTSITWTNPVAGNFAYGALAGVSTYSTAGGGTGSFGSSSSYSTASNNPGAGAGFWYLFKNSAGGGSFCNEVATWSSGGVGEEPGRDGVLP